MPGDTQSATERRSALSRALWLEYFTVCWNLIEGFIAVGAALATGSVALLGFGLDSFIETSSGLILIWRLRTEHGAMDPETIEALDRRASRLVSLSLWGLAVYVTIDAGLALWRRERPQPSIVGIVLATISTAVMQWLARQKRRSARILSSKALESDSFQTSACLWLGVITLVGVSLNAAVHWWWADPVAALGMMYFIAREGREAWRGEKCCP